MKLIIKDKELMWFFLLLSDKAKNTIDKELEKEQMLQPDEIRLFNNVCKRRYELYFYKKDKEKMMWINYYDYKNDRKMELDKKISDGNLNWTDWK